MPVTEPCICPVKGYCERYKRHMSGRPYQICADKCPPEQPCPASDRREAILLHMLGLPAPKLQTSGEAEEIWPPGPGTELLRLIEELGLVAIANCMCKGHARNMNVWGIEKCKEHRKLIAGWLRDGAKELDGVSKLKAMFRAAKSLGIKFKINLFHPYLSLVDEAIRRAETK